MGRPAEQVAAGFAAPRAVVPGARGRRRRGSIIIIGSRVGRHARYGVPPAAAAAPKRPARGLRGARAAASVDPVFGGGARRAIPRRRQGRRLRRARPAPPRARPRGRRALPRRPRARRRGVRALRCRRRGVRRRGPVFAGADDRAADVGDPGRRAAARGPRRALGRRVATRRAVAAARDRRPRDLELARRRRRRPGGPAGVPVPVPRRARGGGDLAARPRR
mmetsp:Transcript_8288/g.34142  ORF Transcript_8288/g.34142 Transcript_8288/m.34142 type:complete len:221 (-) Transcript_8288:67-729(-)